jgi:hypothetical protein
VRYGGRADGRLGGGIMLLMIAIIRLSAHPPLLQAQATVTQLQSGQELIYRGRFGAAQVFFSDLSRQFSRDPAGPALEASSLIWWGEARSDESFQVDAVDSLLADAIGRAQAMVDSAADDGARFTGYFWLGTAYGYRARQAEMRGNVWRASRDARQMQSALEHAVAMDSTCIDCLLGLGIYDYALARASALARLAARIVGLGGGDAQRALERLRRASEEGTLTRTEARWIYASALLREGEHDASLREEGVRRILELAGQFPENPVFRRALPASVGQP